MPIVERDVDRIATERSTYGEVLRMILAGATDDEITAKHPGWCGDVLEICHKIVNGTTCRLREFEVGEKKHRPTGTYNSSRPKRNSEELAAEVRRLRSMRMYEPMRGLDGKWYVRQIRENGVFVRVLGSKCDTLSEAEAKACTVSGFDPESEMLHYRAARREYKRKIREGK